MIAWSLERSGPLANGGGWYYQSITEAINNDGDMYEGWVMCWPVMSA
ncbi:hypothetical protein ULG90_04825 [Halopseudomonas pachastrellae]|nr:hypothetical protein ULG90_04825 [Halopseudomonas pachastrellae]